jgi:hypothetical protein
MVNSYCQAVRQPVLPLCIGVVLVVVLVFELEFSALWELLLVGTRVELPDQI